MEIRLVNAYSLASKICVFTDAMAVLSREPEITLNTLRDAIYQDAVEHGLWKDSDDIVECAKLIIDEVRELWETTQDMTGVNGPQGTILARLNYREELSDVVIMCFSVAGHLGIDIDAAIKRKMEINKGRSYKHENE